MTERYNGWTNYETWCANLWIDQDSTYWDEHTRDIASQQGYDREDSTYELSRVMESYYDEFAPATEGMYADLLNASMSRINWYEIAEHYVDEVLEDKPDEIEE
jgi:hypothetical protein